MDKLQENENGGRQEQVFSSFVLNNEVQEPAAFMKDHGVHVRHDLT